MSREVFLFVMTIVFKILLYVVGCAKTGKKKRLKIIYN